MRNVLYLSYDGLLDPLGQSQVLPYLDAISGKYNVSVLSFEKKIRNNDEIATLRQRLSDQGISWHFTEFTEGRFGVAARVIKGIFLLRKLGKSEKIDLFHLRGLMAAVLFKLSLISTRYLYDFRGFALHEWTDMGKLKASSLFFKILLWLDKSAIRNSSGIVVLEESAKELLGKEYEVPNVPMEVIRTCTDLSKFKNLRPINHGSDAIRFVFLGGVSFPYRPDLAMTFVKSAISRGFKCTIDFINESDHDVIHELVKASGIDSERVNIFKCSHKDIPLKLAEYSCGIVFINTSKWRQVCSPTKLGEFYGAGLPVISLSGIDITDSLASRSQSTHTITEQDIHNDFSSSEFPDLFKIVSDIKIVDECRYIADTEFNLEIAQRSYLSLYKNIGKVTK